MKILLSAYACEPNKGSEPSYGWLWTLGLKKIGHSVTVITRSNNKSIIYKELKKKQIKGINFLFFDLPKWLIFLKNKHSIFLFIYYYLWQYFAYKKFKNISEKNDLIQHITFGTMRVPSFFWKSKTPLIFGPVGGAETTPLFLIKNLTFTQKIKEYLRYILNFIQIKFDLNLKNCFKNSKLIISRSNETKNFINKFVKEKKILTIPEIITDKSYRKKIKKNKTTNFLFAGRHLYWKGGNLIIDAFNDALKKNKNIKLNFVGEGPDKDYWASLMNRYKINRYVSFHSWQSFNKMKQFYKKNDVFIFPSYHDSGGTVINEAISFSLPIICLNLGGPGLKIDKSNGFSINVKSKNMDRRAVVNKLTKKILQLSNNNNLVSSLSNGSYIKSKKYSWNKLIKDIYKKI